MLTAQIRRGEIPTGVQPGGEQRDGPRLRLGRTDDRSAGASRHGRRDNNDGSGDRDGQRVQQGLREKEEMAGQRGRRAQRLLARAGRPLLRAVFRVQILWQIARTFRRRRRCVGVFFIIRS